MAVQRFDLSCSDRITDINGSGSEVKGVGWGGVGWGGEAGGRVVVVGCVCRKGDSQIKSSGPVSI